MNQIQFFNEDTAFQLSNVEKIKEWMILIATSHGFKIRNINYILCSDSYLLEINRQYLNHDYFTDIITFDQSEEQELIEADIFVSVDRVTDNASTLGITPKRELLRVLIHGILHLCGFKDKSPADAAQMRNKEDLALSTLGNL